MNTRTGTTALLLTLLVLPVLAAGVANAQGSDDKIRRGSCTSGTDWKIKAKPDNSRIEVEAEIDSNIDGQTWKWVLKHDGTVSARGTSTTKAPSGSFEVRRTTVDSDGVDAFRFRATNPATDEVCLARIKL